MIFPISVAVHFCHIHSNVYASYKGGCEDTIVDLDHKVTVTEQHRSKQVLVDYLWLDNAIGH